MQDISYLMDHDRLYHTCYLYAFFCVSCINRHQLEQKYRTFLHSQESETCSLLLKVRALNTHAPNVCFSDAQTGSRKTSIETIDLKSFLSGHWSEPCILVVKSRGLSIILACFGCSDEDIKIRTLGSNQLYCSKSCMKLTNPL